MNAHPPVIRIYPDLSLYYQLQYDLHTQAPVGAEALLRSRHNTNNTSPVGLLVESEQNGTITELTTWAINKALEDFPYLRMHCGIQRVAVNTSPSDIAHENLISRIKGLLGKHQLPGSCLELEITERLPLVHLRMAINNIQALNELGVRVVIDDFGTGYTSLPMLINLPVQGIKLDRSFCINLGCSKHKAITEALIYLAQKLRMSVMVEGLESEIQRSKLMLMGCRIGQGFLMHRPQAIEHLQRHR